MKNVLIIAAAAGQDPGVTSNSGGIPGIPQLQNMAGGLMFAALVLCVVGLLIAAGAWAVGSNSSNHQVASRGKMGVLYGLAASIIVGGANALVMWGSGIGSQIK